jgi:DNA-directed RNA polymerase specialized sigma24 family protein
MQQQTIADYPIRHYPRAQWVRQVRDDLRNTPLPTRPRGSRLTDQERDLIAAHYPLIIATARRAIARGYVIDDLVAELALACVIALPRYDRTRAGIAAYLAVVMGCAVRNLVSHATRRPRLTTGTGIEKGKIAPEIEVPDEF